MCGPPPDCLSGRGEDDPVLGGGQVGEGVLDATSQWKDDRKMASLCDHEELSQTRVSPLVEVPGKSGPPWHQARAEPVSALLPQHRTDAFPSRVYLSPCLCGPGGGAPGGPCTPLGLRAPRPQRQQPLTVTFSSPQSQEGLLPNSAETTHDSRLPWTSWATPPLCPAQIPSPTPPIALAPPLGHPVRH